MLSTQYSLGNHMVFSRVSSEEIFIKIVNIHRAPHEALTKKKKKKKKKMAMNNILIIVDLILNLWNI